MRRRLIALLVLVAIGGLVLGGAYFRMPGLEPGMVYVTEMAGIDGKSQHESISDGA